MLLLFLISFDRRYGHLDEIILSLEGADIPITYIDIGPDHEITASGYILIDEFRNQPNSKPVAFFYPYPGYFHLFSFAISNGVPHFRIANSVEELFCLLGVGRDDVPQDNYGRQRLDNMTAVFDSFTKEDFIAFNFVRIYGKIKHFVDDWEGDHWELIEPDLVLITNGDETIEPIVLQAGDDFMGLQLSRIGSSRMFLKNGEIYRQLSAEAEVSGQLTLLGDLTIHLDFISVHYYEAAAFTVSSEYIHMLPRIADFREVTKTFSVRNVAEMMTTLGVTRQDLETDQSIEFTDVTMTFDFTWVSSSGSRASFVAFPSDQ